MWLENDLNILKKTAFDFCSSLKQQQTLEQPNKMYDIYVGT